MSFQTNKKYILLIAFTMLLMDNVLAQRWKMRRYELGAGIGVTQVFGDIGGTIDQKNWFGLKDIKIDETRLAFPVSVRYRLLPLYSLKINGTLAFGHGDDNNSRNNRGRSYKTMLTELSAQGEYYFLAEERRYKSAAMFNKRGMLNNYMSFAGYGFVGIGGVYSRARVTYNGYDPGPYDRVKNNNIGVVIPFGIGLKYILSDRLLINAELGYRLSLTDYIEGFSQIQDSKHKDVYYFLQVGVGYKLNTTSKGIPNFLIGDKSSKGRPEKNAGIKKPRSKKAAIK